MYRQEEEDEQAEAAAAAAAGTEDLCHPSAYNKETASAVSLTISSCDLSEYLVTVCMIEADWSSHLKVI